MKRIFYATAVFIILLILIQAVVSAIISTVISDVYLKSLVTLMLSVGLSLYTTRRLINRTTHEKL